jgi:hypothetical protein
LKRKSLKLNNKLRAACNHFIRAGELHFEKIVNQFAQFIPAKDGARLVAGIGVEVLGDVGLLRSLPINPAYTGQGIAQIPCNKLEHQVEEFKNICPASSACMAKDVQMFLHHP